MSFTLVTQGEATGRVAEDVAGAGVLGLDIETTGLNPLESVPRLLQVNTGKTVWVVDLFQTGRPGPIIEALAASKAPKVIHNAKFEQKFFLHHWGLELGRVFDSFRASAMIHNGRELGHNLFDTLNRELGIAPIEDEGKSDWSGFLTDRQLEYAAYDVRYLPALREKLLAQIRGEGLTRACGVEFGAVLPEASVELNGFRLDAGMWAALAVVNRLEAESLKRKMVALLPDPYGQESLPGIPAGFNLESNPQVLASLRLLGIRLDDTSKTSLAMVAGKYPVVREFQEYRAAAKRVSSFGPDYLDNVSRVTGRIHCDFWPLTGAGRYSCSKPNLQQIPRSMAFRECFRPGPGKKLVIADYSQIEMRLVADISRDPVLTKVFLDGVDPYVHTAHIMSGKPMDQITKTDRQNAKPVALGLMYGMQADKLVLYAMTQFGVAMTVPEAKRYRDRYFRAYAGVAAWHEDTLERGKKSGVARTVDGRLRYLPDAHNEHINTPVQGTGAGGLKAAMANVYARLRKYGTGARMVHIVHDEIVVETDEDPDLCREVKRELEEGMVEGMSQFLTKVPVAVDGSVGDSWGAK